MNKRLARIFNVSVHILEYLIARADLKRELSESTEDQDIGGVSK